MGRLGHIKRRPVAKLQAAFLFPANQPRYWDKNSVEFLDNQFA
jgi:hypothetical protein